MLKKGCTPASTLQFSVEEQLAVTDWLLSMRLHAAPGALELPRVISTLPLSTMISRAPCFFLALASQIGKSPGQPDYPTLVMDSKSPLDHPDKIQVPRLWLSAIDRTLENLNWLPPNRVESLEEDNQRSLDPNEWQESLSAWFAGFPESASRFEAMVPAAAGVAEASRTPELLSTARTNATERQIATIIRLTRGLIEAFESEQRRLDDRLAAIKNLIYGASHEFNNPLANIATRAQTLARNETQADRRQVLETINAQAFRGFDMLAALMHFASPPAPQYERLTASRLTEDAVRALKRFFEPQGRKTLLQPVEISRDSELEADREQVSQVLKALLRNGVETGTPVTLKVHGTELPGGIDAIAFQVADRGPGITPTQLLNACDPFFSGREAGRGLGFGLALAYRIVKMHHGQLRLQAVKEGGLSVTAVFPRTTPAK